MSNNTDVDINSLSNSKKLGGRPKNAVWQHFECYPSKHPGHFGAKCKACNCEWSNGVVNKLQVHLAHTLKKRSKKDICILFQKEMV